MLCDGLREGDERGQPSWLFAAQLSTSVAHVGKIGGLLVERVLLLVHIGVAGVHLRKVSGGGGTNRGFFGKFGRFFGAFFWWFFGIWRGVYWYKARDFFGVK